MNSRNIASFLLNRRLLSYFYKMSHDGFLYESGWIRSFEMKRPVNKDGQPMPWLTLSFLKFMEPRLRQEFAILEYGSGNSTLYYSTKVKSVTSIESDSNWYAEFVQKSTPALLTFT